jgi:hypothetical protein
MNDKAFWPVSLSNSSLTKNSIICAFVLVIIIFGMTSLMGHIASLGFPNKRIFTGRGCQYHAQPPIWWGQGSVFVTRWPSYPPDTGYPFYSPFTTRMSYVGTILTLLSKKTEFVLIIWHYYDDQIKEMRLSGTYHTWDKCKMNSKVWSKTPKGTDHLKDLGVDEREILKLVWNTHSWLD